ncbi:UNVERIFIED_CONTAM: hypothetical protein GTU68_052933, partial [Idotea baltica]|nr:hypothetical protein [Idotea baltica]
MSSILIIDDDKDANESLLKALSVSGINSNIFLASNEDSTLIQLGKNTIDVVILDLCLVENQGVESGFSLLNKILTKGSTIKVIVLTGHGSNENGVRALNLGASNFLEKPADISHLAALIKDCLRQSELLRENKRLVENSDKTIEKIIVGKSDLIKKLRADVLYAASNNQAVFLAGETGTGKGLCAQTIHNFSNQNGSFIRYQPSLLKSEMGASELFGHVKGSFTGALSDKRGLISLAEKGTLFLDEIDEFSLEIQVGLLGFLQDSNYRAVGSEEILKGNCRIISATNYPVDNLVNDNKLRSDFYYRIASQKILIPALRDRIEDIPELAKSFLEKTCLKNNLNVYEIENKALATLSNHKWPGNIRELE